jgi:hypothetical protein
MSAMTPGQAFLWLLRAGDQEARPIIDELLGDTDRRWSEIVQKNLANHIKKPAK